jgi:RHS repeat-associated protein
MKKILLLLAFISSTCTFSQELFKGGTPVEGIIAIERNAADFKNPPASKTVQNVTNPLPTTPTGNSTEVGNTEGALSVSLSGGANYTMPIAVPPGLNGVVPQVSLSYNSQGGNGLAGYGWNVSGVSVITRIAATKFHDNTIDAVDFDGLDRFAFDGQRLVVKNGTTGVYGANNTVYETESFSNVQITSYGVHPKGANFGPAYFLVQYPDGSIAEYGNTSTSRSLTDWAITYWQNPQGVRISYDYTLVDNNLSISSIKYGTLTDIAPINEILFVYKNRVRPEQAYIGGESFVRNTILSAINVKGNGAGFRNYYLKHDTTTLGYERLISITEKSGDLSQSLNPTVFRYDDTSEMIAYQPAITTGLNVGNISLLNSATVSGDYDGDGKMDFLLYPTIGVDAKSKFWLFKPNAGQSTNLGYEVPIGKFEELFSGNWLSDDSKLIPWQGIIAVSKDTSIPSNIKFNTYSLLPYGVYLQHSKSFSWTNYSSNPVTTGSYKVGVEGKYLSGDFNGDGITDQIIIRCNNIIRNCTGNNCSQFNDTKVLSTEKDVYFVNLDSRLSGNYSNLAGYLMDNLTLDSKCLVADVNGDGVSDLLIFENGKVTAYNLTSSNQLNLLWTYMDSNISVATTSTILLGDYNGDGKADFIIPKEDGSNEWYKYSSTGNNFVKETQYYSGFPYATANGINSYHHIAIDFNNDGKTDLMRVICNGNAASNTGKISVSCIMNKNGTFAETAGNVYYGASGMQSGIDQFALPIFLNADNPNNNLEIACISGNKIHYFQSQKDFNVEKLVKDITVGNGVKNSISYDIIDGSDSDNYYNNIYTSSTLQENYPNIDLITAPSFQVVSKIEHFSSSSYKKQIFKYYGAVLNVEGLGFLGFRGTLQTNWHDENSQTISNVSRFNPSFRGACYETYSALGLGSPYYNAPSSNYITKTLNLYNTYDNVNFDVPLLLNKVFKLKNTISKRFNGLENTSVEVVNSYDDFLNITQSTTSIQNESNIEKTEVSSIDYLNQTTGAAYYVGRPKQKKTSVTYNGDERTSEELYDYNPAQLLSQVKKKGHQTNYLTEDNIYDVYGNITKKTITAIGWAPRETNFEYDENAPNFGRFLTKSKDIEGKETSFNYNGDNGLLVSKIDPSNPDYPLSTSYWYDVWGKKTKIKDYLNKNIKYVYTKPEVNTVQITVNGDDGSSSFTKYDDLGRSFLSGAKNINNVWDYESTLYDIYDRAFKVSEPFNGAEPSQWTETFYDQYGRTIKTIQPNTKTTNISYSGLTSTVDDGIKNVVTVKNASGNVISSTDNGGTIKYDYYANGNLKQSDFNGVKIAILQDGWGRKIEMSDPSAGVYRYEYNDFGETLKETVAGDGATLKGSTTYKLNESGKLIYKEIIGENEDTTNSRTTYEYDNTTKLLNSSVYEDLPTGNSSTYQYEYDSYKRLTTTIEKNALAGYRRDTTFDEFGRPERETYNAELFSNNKSSTKTIVNTYKNGKHWQILDGKSNHILWQTDNVNARGQLTNASFGNGITITNAYNDFGLPTQIKHEYLNNDLDGGGTTNELVDVMTLNTDFNNITGNLNSRSNSLFNNSDNFSYDNLDRLAAWSVDNVVLHNINFNGNSSSEVEGFNPINGGTTSVFLNKLTVKTKDALSGTERPLLSNAFVGTQLNINVKIPQSGVNKVDIFIVEENVSTGYIQQYSIGTINSSVNAVVFNYDYTVVGDESNVSIRFVKSTTSNDLGVWKTFTLDNFIITKYLSESQSYDDLGRIDQNNLGNYEYDKKKQFQNSSISKLSEKAKKYYDSRLNLDVKYNVFKSPISIYEEGIDKIDFQYNAANSRQTMYYGSLADEIKGRKLRKHYSMDGSMEIKENTDTGEVEIIIYICGDGYTAPVVYKSDDKNQQYLYLHRDYQGSILAITDQLANIVEKRAFDPWGNITRVEDGAGNVLTKLTVLDRGYTGHEHLQSVNLINMNGRIYDPIVHRFLQPDNFVQDPYNTQNYNRYGYCLNNPLKYTDYNGESFWSDLGNGFSKAFKTIVSVEVAIVTATIGVAMIGTAFTIGTIVGVGQFVGSGFQNSSILSNEFKIIGGLFQGNIGQIASRFTKELPQTLLGLGLGLGYNAAGRVKSVSYYGGATAIETYDPRWGALTLGSYIIGENGIHADTKNSLFKHEYGHYLQSQDVGWNYIYKYAIPSAINAYNLPELDKGNIHSAYWTEQDANIRGRDYFGSQNWDYFAHPIFDSGYNPWFDLLYQQYR